jgi:hypothetical protein
MSCRGRAIGGRSFARHTAAGSAWVRALAALCLVTGASCTLLPVAGGMDDCSDALLAGSDPAGAACLERMVQEGGELSSQLEQRGKPDYFELSSKRARLLYIERDEIVEVSRSATGGLAVRTSSPIRASDHMRFRNDDRVRLGQARVNRVPATSPVEEERPNQVLRARVGEGEPEPEPEEPEPGAPQSR